MDFCRVLESWDWLNNYYYGHKEVRESLKNLFLETIFEITDMSCFGNTRVRVKLTKEFNKKVDKIVLEYKVRNISEDYFHLKKEHVRFVSFVDIWEMKRAGLR